MFAPVAHFSLVELTDPQQHRSYNAAQQLGLLPELRALPGVAWVDRFVCSPECAALRRGSDPALGRIHYVDMVWFRAPTEPGIRAFDNARQRSVQLGEASFASWVRQPLQGLFIPLQGYVHPRVNVAPDALPFRPTRGAFLLVTRFARRDADAEAAYHWYDQERIPDLLSCRGAAGAWSFATADVFRPDRDIEAPVTRIVLIYLDDDPLVFLADMTERSATWRQHDPSGVEDVLLATPLRTVEAWQWDWFDRHD